MAWVKIATGMARHPKLLSVSPADRWVHISGMCWTAENGTDGVIPRHVIDVIAPGAKAAAKRLVAAGLWDVHADGWCIHDWTEHNISSEEADRQRQVKTERQRQWRAKRAAAKAASVDGLQDGLQDGLHDGLRDGLGDGRESLARKTRHDTTLSQRERRVVVDDHPAAPPPAPAPGGAGSGAARDRDGDGLMPAHAYLATATDDDSDLVRAVRRLRAVPCPTPVAP